LGGFRTTYADSLDAAAATLGADGAWSWRATRLELGGSLATFESDGWAASGTGSWAATLTSGRTRGLFASADASGYGFDGGTWAGLGTAGLTAATRRGPATGSMSATVGGLRRLDGTDDLHAQATARVRRDRGSLALDAWGSAARAGSVRYGDLAASLRMEGQRATLDLSGGGRFGDLGDVAWAQARLALRVAGPGWLEASAGRYPPDPTGFATGTFVQAGIRINLGREVRATGSAEPAIRVTHELDGTVLVVLHVTERTPVAIAGDWNGWSAQPLERVDEHRWRARLVLSPGLHRFTLLDPDGNAFVPPGVTAEPDEFGTMTAFLAVPHR
jgi:hypothetical protein